MRADGSHQRLLVDEPDWADGGPSFTADGKRILYSRCGTYVDSDVTCKIVSVRLDGTGRRTVIGGTWEPSDPVMSPDGSRIAYVSDAGGIEGRVWVSGARGRHRHPVGRAHEVERVSWSPDGRHLLFTGYRTDTTFAMRADGTHLHTVASHTIFSVWSPDGRRIVSKRSRPDDGFGPLRVLRRDGSHPVRIVPGRLGPGYSDWGTRP
jgi:Tol biopolymer transport system component